MVEVRVEVRVWRWLPHGLAATLPFAEPSPGPDGSIPRLRIRSSRSLASCFQSMILIKLDTSAVVMTLCSTPPDGKVIGGKLEQDARCIGWKVRQERQRHLFLLRSVHQDGQ